MRYALYARKSTSDKDERQAQSIGDQERYARDHAARLNLHIHREFTEARSAKEPYKTIRSQQRIPVRPAFHQMIRLVESGEIEGLIAWHPDRLSRNEIDAATITHLLRTGKLKDLQFCNYTFDNSPEGIMMLQMALSQSQYYSSKLAKDVKRGMQSKIEKGWHPHKAPVGYLNDKHMEKGQKTISPDPERFETIRQAWDLLLSGGYSIAAIRRILNEEWRYRSPLTKSGGGKPMTKSTLHRIFSNPFYAGYFRQKGVLYEGRHQPMVTLDEFQQVQRLLEAKGVIKPRARELAYTGMMKCATCGAQVTGHVVKKASGRFYTYYHCQNATGRCTKKSIEESQLEATIRDYLGQITIEPIFQQWAWEAYEVWKQTAGAARQETTERSQRTLEEVKRQLDNLLTLKLKELIGDEEYTQKRAELMLERDRLVRQVRDDTAQVEQARAAMENVLLFLRNARAWFDLGDVWGKRSILWALGSNYVLREQKLLLELHPLLQPVQSHYPDLEKRYREIKLHKTGSQTWKNSGLERIRFNWSSLWHQNLTRVVERKLFFPRIAGSNRIGNGRIVDLKE